MPHQAMDAQRCGVYIAWGVTTIALVVASVMVSIATEGAADKPSEWSGISRWAWITCTSVLSTAAAWWLAARWKWRAAMQEVAKQTRALADGARLILWTSTPTTRVIEYVSPGATMGYSNRDWFAADFWSRHIHPDDYERAVSSRLGSESGSSGRVQYRMLAADGRTVWVEDCLIAERRAEGAWTARGMLIDITDSRQAIELANAAASQRAAVTMSAGVVHELGTLLFAASIALQHAAPRDVLKEDSRFKRLSAIVRQAQGLAGALLDLFSQADEGGPQVHSLNPWLPDVIASMAGALPPGIRVTTDVDAGLPEVRAHPLGLEQVLRTVVFNAATAMGGQGKVHVFARVVAADGRRLVEVRISDDGPGVAEELRSQIFSPGFTTHRRSDRSGLGLAIATQILEHFGGTISIEPGVPAGSIFVIRLLAHHRR